MALAIDTNYEYITKCECDASHKVPTAEEEITAQCYSDCNNIAYFHMCICVAHPHTHVYGHTNYYIYYYVICASSVCMCVVLVCV